MTSHFNSCSVDPLPGISTDEIFSDNVHRVFSLN